VSASGTDQELLQRDAFGETSAEERAALHQRLRVDPALRAEHEKLVDVRRRLNQVGLVDPPPGLRQSILRAIRESAPREMGSWAWLGPLLVRRPAFALGSALAVGLACGILVTGLLTGGSLPAVDESSVAGTMLPRGVRGDLPVVDRVRLEGAGLRAEAVARRASGVVVADLVIEPPRTAEVFVETGGSGLVARGFEAPGGLPAAGAVLEAAGVYIADAPPGRYLFVLTPTAAGSGELRIRLQSPDGRVEGRLRVGTVSVPALAESAKN